ncbi:hypothetical protein Cni_G26123 [Canna indica]|uniref:Uncharacterized protein n=1 Tax=Canna indica TaxID=4628 RepID=A0AAQ3L1F8_9LILI|nr:hypothetical protein Cni_G26123 [Canna indica]
MFALRGVDDRQIGAAAATRGGNNNLVGAMFWVALLGLVPPSGDHRSMEQERATNPPPEVPLPTVLPLAQALGKGEALAFSSMCHRYKVHNGDISL